MKVELPNSVRVALSFLIVTHLVSCVATDSDPESIGSVSSNLSAAERRARAEQIRDAANANGIHQGWLLAGIADAETSMAHCHRELTWACRGPASSDCGGGPVVAGAGDGPCRLRQGGLGMFQFDAGTYEQTLAREGRRILSVAGNVAAAVDFAVNMVIRSTFISGVSTRAQAIDWMNSVTSPSSSRFGAWYRTVTRYYNGCSPSSSCWPSRTARYRDHAADIYSEFGTDFWSESGTDPALGIARGVVYVNGDSGDLSERVDGARVVVRETDASATVGADGAWSFELAPGTYTIEATADGFEAATRTCEVTGGTSWCSFGMDRGSSDVRVSGVIFDSSSEDMSRRIANASVRIAQTSTMLTTDANGTWSTEVAPGAYRLEVSAPDFVTATRDCVVEPGMPVWCSLGLMPVPISNEPDGRLIGVVYVDGSISTRIPGATVRVLETGATATAGDRSALWLFDLPGGVEYTIEARGEGFLPRSRTCRVTSNSTGWCSIGLERAGRGGGLHTTEDGRAVEDIPADEAGRPETFEASATGGCAAGGGAPIAPVAFVALLGLLRRRWR